MACRFCRQVEIIRPSAILQPFSFFQMGNGKKEMQLLLNSANRRITEVSLANLERHDPKLGLALVRGGSKKKKVVVGERFDFPIRWQEQVRPLGEVCTPAPGSGPSLRRAIAGDSRKRRCALREALLQRTLRKQFI